MNNSPKSALFSLLSALCLANVASAAIQLSFSGTVDVGELGDPYQIDGSTWSFTFTSSDTVYSDLTGDSSVPYLNIDSAILTVSGAENEALNGTYDFSDQSPIFVNGYYGLFMWGFVADTGADQITVEGETTYTLWVYRYWIDE